MHTTAHSRRFRFLTALLLALLFAPGAGAFWFICSYRDAARKARVADKAKERYNEYLASPTATRAQTEGCKRAWDILRKATLADLKKFATSVPGTILTGPPSVRKMTKKAIQEVVKEVLGNVAAMSAEGAPTPLSSLQNGELFVAEGELVAAFANADLPVEEVLEENLSNFEIAFVNPDDYAGAGDPSDLFYEGGPLLLLSGAFSDVQIGSFGIDAMSAVALANGGATFGAVELAAALGVDPTLGEWAFASGMFSQDLLQWAIDQAFPWGGGLALDMSQVALVTLTNVDPALGTISGTFFSVAGPRPQWHNGFYDYQVATASELGTSGIDSRAADDFELPVGNGRDWKVAAVSAEILQSSEWTNNQAQLEIYRDVNGAPENGPPIAVVTSRHSEAVGFDLGMTVHRYIFEPNVALAPGRYWLAPIGLGDGSLTDRASAASANHPDIRLSQAHVLRPAGGATTWMPVENVDGIATDLAFFVDAEQMEAPMMEDGFESGDLGGWSSSVGSL